MKKKLIFIAPHLSTGGMPQYLFKQIELLNDEFDIYCIEWDNVTGGKLIIQRNRILNLLGEKLITLKSDKKELFDIIDKINPDIIHLQEVPEMFMQYEIANTLYDISRKYIIIETSHDSSYDVSKKLHFPDKFLLVSQYQINNFNSIGIPCALIEYPIEYKVRLNTREELITKLGLDPSKKHIINVGLFTPRKNQVEVIEYAKKLIDQPIQFHFLGNQADNFKYYWEPIMKDFPSNCKWWDEVSNVDEFYQIADLFLFTSRGSDNDKETMPLVIREAISWNTQSLIYNLPVYLNYFDKYKNISYLDFSSNENNIDLILKILNINKTKNVVSVEIPNKMYEIMTNYYQNNILIEGKNKIFIIDVYATTEIKLNLLNECIKSIKPLGYPIMLVSHCILPENIIKSVDYHLYNADNKFNNCYNYSYNILNGVEIRQNTKLSHEFPIIKSMDLAFNAAKNLGYDYFYFCEFDHKYSENGLEQIKNLEKEMNEQGKDNVFFYPKEAVFGSTTGEFFESSLFFGKLDKFLNYFNNFFPKKLETYNEVFVNQFPNCLEYFFYKCFNESNSLFVPSYVKNYFNDSEINVSSYLNIKYNILLDDEKNAFLIIASNDLIEYNFEVYFSDRQIDFFTQKHSFKIIELKDSCEIKINVFCNEKLFETKILEYNSDDKDTYHNNGCVIFHDINLKPKKKTMIPIDIKYNENENKFDFSYLDNINENILLSIKDIDSKACIYSTILNKGVMGVGFWVIPLPKNVIDFKNNQNFGGFLIEFYNENQDLIESRDIRIKNIPIYKPVINISNTEPVFLNYEEFFISGLYDSYDLDNCNVVFDIGANVGLWTKYILTRNPKKVYCFEPNKKALSHLKKSLENNDNITIIDKAVYEKNTTLPFFLDDTNSLISSLIPESGFIPSYDVEAITLEDAIKNSKENKIDLVKMDIEGSEFGIIENLSKETADKIDSFLIEYHDFYFKEGFSKVIKLIERLKSLGFIVEKSTIENSKFIYASKIRKNYWMIKNQQVKLYNLYDFSKDFSWDKMNVGLNDGNNHMFKEMYFTNDDYTKGCVYERFGCKIEQGDIVVDLGANIGVFANAAYYKGASKIFCFEPSEPAFKCLIKNKPINAEIFKLGVSNISGFEKISIPSTDNTVCASFITETNISENVMMTTIDELFKNNIFDKIDFLKIDVEGYEKKVLEGISDENLSKIKKISLEFHANFLNDDDSIYIMDRMVSNGFSTFQLFIDDGVLRIYNFWK